MAHFNGFQGETQLEDSEDDSQSLPNSPSDDDLDDDVELQLADLVTRREAADFFVSLSSQLFRSHPEATYELTEQLASRFGLSALRLEEGACGAARAAGQTGFEGPRLALQAELQKLSRWRDTLRSLNGALRGGGVRRAGAAAAAAATAAWAAGAGGSEAAEPDGAEERMPAVTVPQGHTQAQIGTQGAPTTAPAAPARLQMSALAATASHAPERATHAARRKVGSSHVVLAYVSWLRHQGLQLPLLERMLEQQGCRTARAAGVLQAYTRLPDPVKVSRVDGRSW